MRYFYWPLLKRIIRRAARTHGFLDPLTLYSNLEAFAQPSEVAAPVELLRAGLVFHARGMLNTKAIQSNLDWNWPYWIRHQFDPHSDAFIPRSFSVTHVNLTHRNWTAVGIPNCHPMPIIDPRGLVTPHLDGWSIDAFVQDEEGNTLVPARTEGANQQFHLGEKNVSVRTWLGEGDLHLASEASVILHNGRPMARIRYRAQAPGESRLAVSLRPFNPEGVSLIQRIKASSTGKSWLVDRESPVYFSRPAAGHAMSTYHQGDVMASPLGDQEISEVHCRVGMATAAAAFPFKDHGHINVYIPLKADPETPGIFPAGEGAQSWDDALENVARLRIPNEEFQFLYDAAVRSLILHSPLDVYPGPYTYKRFWFRDAALMLNAMSSLGMHSRVERLLDQFLPRQDLNGYFRSQEGEWDSNGQVLWAFKRHIDLSGQRLKKDWRRSILRGARWIDRKRQPDDLPDLDAGLLPAGFSAEHLGNNDYYYWDDYWSVAGLRSASELFAREGNQRQARRLEVYGERLMNAIERSLERSRSIRGIDAIPASPHRRMDAGAIGSIASGYPLQIYPPNHIPLLNTVNFLREQCSFEGTFFQDMIHSGINVYLSIHIAQVLLRSEDPEFYPIVEKVAGLASPTGQWPEAIHPRTRGGCMGDGQHIWAAAEWLMMIRNMFVREEGETLVLASGLVEEMRQQGETIEFGPTATPFGDISLSLEETGENIRLSWKTNWRHKPDSLVIALPGFENQAVDPGQTYLEINKSSRKEHKGGTTS